MPKSLTLQKELASYISDTLREVGATKPRDLEDCRVMHIRGNLGDDIADGETGFTPAAVSASSDRHRVQAKEEFLHPSTPPPHTHTQAQNQLPVMRKNFHLDKAACDHLKPRLSFVSTILTS